MRSVNGGRLFFSTAITRNGGMCIIKSQLPASVNRIFIAVFFLVSHCIPLVAGYTEGPNVNILRSPFCSQFSRHHVLSDEA